MRRWWRGGGGGGRSSSTTSGSPGGLRRVLVLPDEDEEEERTTTDRRRRASSGRRASRGVGGSGRGSGNSKKSPMEGIESEMSRMPRDRRPGPANARREPAVLLCRAAGRTRSSRLRSRTFSLSARLKTHGKPSWPSNRSV